MVSIFLGSVKTILGVSTEWGRDERERWLRHPLFPPVLFLIESLRTLGYTNTRGIRRSRFSGLVSKTPAALNHREKKNSRFGKHTPYCVNYLTDSRPGIDFIPSGVGPDFTKTKLKHHRLVMPDLLRLLCGINPFNLHSDFCFHPLSSTRNAGYLGTALTIFLLTSYDIN